MAIPNTYTTSGSSPNVASVYPQEWATKLQERLNKPTTWKDVANVIYSNSYIVNFPYMSTEFSAQTGTRGCSYGFSEFTLTNDQVEIKNRKIVPIHIDEADLAQCTLAGQMELAERQGALIDEAVESAMLANHTAWTDFGDTGGGALGLGSTQITVADTNIDDIVRGVREQVITANGLELMNRNGLFFVWRAGDMKYLEKFCQSNGYTLADKALKDGVPNGYYILGAYHYISNSHTANHVFAGVRRIEQIGILKATYGQIKIIQDPASGVSTYGPVAGIGVRTMVDYGVNTPTGLTTLLYDVNVANVV